MTGACDQSAALILSANEGCPRLPEPSAQTRPQQQTILSCDITAWRHFPPYLQFKSFQTSCYNHKLSTETSLDRRIYTRKEAQSISNRFLKVSSDKLQDLIKLNYLVSGRDLIISSVFLFTTSARNPSALVPWVQAKGQLNPLPSCPQVCSF